MIGFSNLFIYFLNCHLQFCYFLSQCGFKILYLQCYDQYLLKSLRKTAEVRGHPYWARGPDNAGSYNSQPHETGFFCDGGDYDGYYGRFFLNWYARVLLDHGNRVLSLTKLAFEGTCVAAKVSQLLRKKNLSHEMNFSFTFEIEIEIKAYDLMNRICFIGPRTSVSSNT